MRKIYFGTLFLAFILSGFTATAQRLSGGRTFTLSVCADSTVWAWGDNASGQLGDNTKIRRDKPVQVHGPGNVGFLKSIIAVKGYEYGSLALRADGTVWAWGGNGYGQLGDSTTTQSLVPKQVHGVNNVGFLTDIVQLGGAGDFCAALKSDGTVYTWGFNFYGQLGNNTKQTVGSGPGSMVPVQVHGTDDIGFLTGVKAISSGYGHTICLKNDGTVWTFGENGNWQIGDNTQVRRLTPVQVHGAGDVGFLTDVVKVTAGGDCCMALKSDSSVWAWGFNNTGLLGDATQFVKGVPIPVHGAFNVGFLDDVKDIYSSLTNNFAVQYDGTVLAWGPNSRGQIGDNSNVNRNIPVTVHGVNNVGNFTDATEISGGLFFTVASKADGTIYTWGNKDNGQLGDSSVADRLVPKEISGVCGVAVICNAVSPSLFANDSLICASDSAIIQTTGTYTTYKWNNNDNRSYTAAKNAGGYWVTVTDANGCTAVSSRLNIAVLPVSSISVIVQGDTLSSFNASSYQWFLNGDSIPGATSPIYKAMASGFYSLQVTDSNGCKANSSPIEVLINGIAGLVESPLSVYPNPFNSNIFIDGRKVNAIIQNVEIYDLPGQLVYSKYYGQQDKLIQADLSDLANGMYYLRIKTSSGNYHHPVIKQ